MKKCQNGVICIENMTLFTMLILIGLLMAFLFYSNNKSIIKERIIINQSEPILTTNNEHYFNNNSNVIGNIYSPPLNPPQTNDLRGWPVNVSTRPIINNNYSQQGILTRINGVETILPLMGKQLMSGRDKWQYYTISDKNNSVKLPLSVNGKSCTSEYGCDGINNGDTVYVEGYGDAFKVTMYENSSLNYIPYL